MIITDYKSSKLCGLKGSKHNASCGELIFIYGKFLRDFDVSLCPISFDRNNTATNADVIGKNPLPFIFTCDEDNHFDIISDKHGNVTFFQIYRLNENDIYTNVYLFELNDSKYYIARNIGAIRIVKAGVFDYTLTDKSVKQ
jgi:hypothetical protein